MASTPRFRGLGHAQGHITRNRARGEARACGTISTRKAGCSSPEVLLRVCVCSRGAQVLFPQLLHPSGWTRWLLLRILNKRGWTGVPGDLQLGGAVGSIEKMLELRCSLGAPCS